MSSQQSLVQKQAPCVDRCIASFIDGIFMEIPCYCLWKDGIRDGRSIGKGLMGLRVVKFSTGQPATITDSCLRNCLQCCPLLLLVTEGKRRFGDLVAGTIVIKDS